MTNFQAAVDECEALEWRRRASYGAILDAYPSSLSIGRRKLEGGAEPATLALIDRPDDNSVLHLFTILFWCSAVSYSAVILMLTGHFVSFLLYIKLIFVIFFEMPLPVISFYFGFRLK